MLRNLFTAAFKLTDNQRRQTVRVVAGLAGLLLLCVLMFAGHTAASEPGTDHPIWEVAVLFRVALARLVLALALIPIGASAGLTLYQALENSELGRRLLIWDAIKDSPETMARKVGNAGLLASTLLLASILGLLVGVLR